MSPANAMDRAYGVIKQMLRDGAFAPGQRLEANRLAYELGVSMTPVRDVLYRLAGEQLVDAALGEGFHVPRFSETGLRDLYEWHSALMSFASRTVDIGGAVGLNDSNPDISQRMAALVERIAVVVPNREVGAALRSASDRLQPFRRAEVRVFDDLQHEFDEFQNHSMGLANAIRRYHLRRMRAVSSVVSAREER